jgi:Protein of unknown function (DUF3304)
MNYLQKIFLLALITCCCFTACKAEDDTRSVTFVGYNYTERPIFTFSVNGVGGGNIFVNGGGGSLACCGDITIGKPAVIKWMYSYTKKQYEAGLREETHTATVIVPPPQIPTAGYLEVHFYPDHHVELAVVKFPGPRRLPDLPEDN